MTHVVRLELEDMNHRLSSVALLGIRQKRSDLLTRRGPIWFIRPRFFKLRWNCKDALTELLLSPDIQWWGIFIAAGDLKEGRSEGPLRRCWTRQFQFYIFLFLILKPFVSLCCRVSWHTGTPEASSKLRVRLHLPVPQRKQAVSCSRYAAKGSHTTNVTAPIVRF